MEEKQLAQYVRLSDIPETYQPIAALIGIDAFLKLCQYGSGDEIYFPMPKTIFRKARNRLLIQEYNGYNLEELSKKYSLTANQVKNIIKRSDLA